MDKKDILECLALLKVAYPYIYRDICDNDIKAIINLWSFSFANQDPQKVKYAVSSLISTSRNVPSIAEIKDYISRVEDIASGAPTDGEMWNLLLKAVRNGYYGYREEYEKLPEELKTYVGAPEQLKAWSQIDESVFNSVHQSNFMKNFKASRKRTAEARALPQNIRDLISGNRSKMLMPEERETDENERRNELLEKLERM